MVEQTDAPAPPGAEYARANADASDARDWLRAAFRAQREAGDPDALTADQQQEISLTLTMEWWQTAAAEDDGGQSTVHTDLIVDLLPAAVRAAAGIPDGSTVLALYVRNLVNEAWELSWDHRLIRATVNAAVTAAAEHPQTAVDRVAWRLLRFMLEEFCVESALLTGRLRTVRAATATAARTAEELFSAAERLDDSLAAAALRAECDAERRYYRAVHEIAGETEALLTRRSTSASDALAHIDADIRAGAFLPVDASELRGHLASLEAVESAVGRDWLHIVEGRVRIVYGFGIIQPPTDDGRAELAALRTRLQTRSAREERLGGLRIDAVLRRLALSDVWQGADSLGRGYRGTTVQLEDLVLDEADEDGDLVAAQSIGVHVQISELGNHCIVFDIDLDDAAALEVAQVVSLATPVFGDLTEIPHLLRMRPESLADARIRRLADVVTDVLADLRDLLVAERDDDAADPIAARTGSFGVIVTVERAARDIRGVLEPLTSARELPELWGAQPLLHPLPAGASGVADWTMYDVSHVERFDLLHLNDELLTANANVTLLASFRSPEYAVAEIESFITFAHSMHGMHQAWQTTVHAHAERIADLLRRVGRELVASDAAAEADDERAQEQVLGRLGALVREIERAELALQSFVQSKQATLLFVESPTIVTSPALRIDLDAVLRSNRYALLREGFERAVDDVLGSRLQPLLDVCHRRIALLIEDRQAERERRTEQLAQVLGMILAVIGVSGLISVLQAGFDLRGDITWWFVVSIIVVAVVLGAVLIVAARLRRARRPSGDRPTPDTRTGAHRP